MTFTTLIRKYHALYEGDDDISFLLNRLGIYNDIASPLNEFYRAADGKVKTKLISQLVWTTSELVTVFYEVMQNLHGKEREEIELFIKYIITDCYHISCLSFLDFFEILIQSSRKTFQRFSWDFSVLEKWLSFENIKQLSESNNKTKQSSKPVSLEWQGEKQLDLFVDDLTKVFHGLKSRKNMFLLFELEKPDFKIELSSGHLVSFLSLFHELHESGAIKVNGNRGLFIYLHEHLQAPPTDRYPRREFRKLRYDAWQNLKTRQNISKVIKPIVEKYSRNGR